MITATLSTARHEHGALTPLLSLSEVSIARTWRLHGASATAGDEARLLLHCGQVRRTRRPPRLVVQVVPLKSRMAAEAASEQLRRAIILRDPAKGEGRTIRFGPVCVSGAHLLCVTLDGAHIIGSPLQLDVLPGVPDVMCCDVRPLHRTGERELPKQRECHGEVGTPVAFAVQLRDRLSNANTVMQAQAVLTAGRLSASVKLLEQPSGSSATAWPPGFASEAAGEATVKVHFGAGGADGEGVVVVALSMVRAGMYRVTMALDGRSFTAPMTVHVSPSQVVPSASTLHGAKGSTTALWRCTAGVQRELWMVARDHAGNAHTAPRMKWSLTLLAPDAKRHTEHELSGMLHYALPSNDGIAGERVLHAASRVGSYTISAVGRFELEVKYGGVHVSGSPLQVRALPAAWGHGLHEAFAGMPNRFWVRLSDDGTSPPNSPEGRRLMHLLHVEVRQSSSMELARVTCRQVAPVHEDCRPQDVGADEFWTEYEGGGEVVSRAGFEPARLARPNPLKLEFGANWSEFLSLIRTSIVCALRPALDLQWVRC